jgi:lipopolysaccharide transport system ATP-binding protein
VRKHFLVSSPVLKPQAKVIVHGRISPLLELGGGFHPELAGRENIMLNGVLLGMTRAKIKSKMKEIIEFSEFGNFIDQPIRVYSSGMLARLGFSVVACLDPEILLIDEILAVGDMEFQKVHYKMMGFKKEGPIVFVFIQCQMWKEYDWVIWIENRSIRMAAPEDIAALFYLKINRYSGPPFGSAQIKAYFSD